MIVQGMAGYRMGDEGQRLGGIRAGVWDSDVCIEQDMEKGTVLPFLREAKNHGYAVMVLNPNENLIEGEPVIGSESAICHIDYVWDHLISLGPADERDAQAAKHCHPEAQVDFIAHGNGAGAMVQWILRASYKENAENKLKKTSR